jgi:hypothetical protein
VGGVFEMMMTNPENHLEVVRSRGFINRMSIIPKEIEVLTIWAFVGVRGFSITSVTKAFLTPELHFGR